MSAVCSEGESAKLTAELINIITHENRNTEELLDVIEKGADVTGGKGNRGLPLVLACDRDSVHMVKLLIQFGADVNEPDYDGWFPLHVVADSGDSDLAAFLLEKGASVYVRSFSAGATPIHDAAYCGSASSRCLQLFLEAAKKEDPTTILNLGGHTPLFNAFYCINVECIYVLLNWNAVLYDAEKPAVFNEFAKRIVATRARGPGKTMCTRIFKNLLLMTDTNAVRKWSTSPDIPAATKNDVELWNLIGEVSSKPRSLKSLCRVAVRKNQGFCFLPDRLMSFRVHYPSTWTGPPSTLDDLWEYLLYEPTTNNMTVFRDAMYLKLSDVMSKIIQTWAR